MGSSKDDASQFEKGYIFLVEDAESLIGHFVEV